MIEYLVNEVWCKADNKQCKSKLNNELKALYEDQPWFQEQVKAIYKVCKSLTIQEKEDFKTAFAHNNRIEELCDRTIAPIALSTLNKALVKVVKPFFKKLYTNFLGWKAIRDSYGEKKTYYDELNLNNGFIHCPCCGYGDLKTIYSKGRSAFDHYLPQKHYPFSSTNFNNLVPICTTCNSDEKGEVDVLKEGKPIYYPFAKNHPNIDVSVDVDRKVLKKLIEPTNDLKSKITKSEIKVDFNLQDDKTKSWNRIFDIKTRYFGKVADNRVSWLDDVRQIYRDPDTTLTTYEAAFDKVIETDSNKYLGFLKTPYLKSMKSNSHLIKAMDEVSGSSIISN
ncbi:hypothetical protein J2X69_004022 [Algoriphagus sp. 4150]|uniref:hypothetical protein n=1 Tax=Algoriphagus sp. 4150 TaxID=2817756 RepID=UPI0028626F00|nr:hypothetical protein [Algoriphagus sp. 4150]MDR7131658.1 hypothetical protein [Algoriphagus sp. 4150]